MKLPLAILVLAKDEEKVIEDCLRPWVGLVKEMLVLDTGSSDETPRLAQKMGAEVVAGKLAGDFSRARNRLLGMAQAEWVLFLDADQMVSKADINKLASLLADPAVDAYRLPIRHYTDDYNLLAGWRRVTGEYPAEERRARRSGYFLSHRHLLFRNHRGIRYEYPIHESILPILGRKKFKTKSISVTIHHREFEKGERHHLKKHKKYLVQERRLLREISSHSPCYATLLRCMICNLISTGGELTEAEQINRRLIRFSRDAEALSLSGRIAWLRGKRKVAYRRLRESLEIESSADTLCLLGWLKLDCGEFSSAERYLNQALRRRKDHPVGHFLKGSLAWEKKDRKSALAYTRQALHLHPGYKQAALRLTEFQDG